MKCDDAHQSQACSSVVKSYGIDFEGLPSFESSRNLLSNCTDFMSLRATATESSSSPAGEWAHRCDCDSLPPSIRVRVTRVLCDRSDFLHVLPLARSVCE